MLIVGFRGRVAGVAPPPPLIGKFYKNCHVGRLLGLHPSFPDRAVGKSSHDRLHPPPPFKISKASYLAMRVQPIPELRLFHAGYKQCKHSFRLYFLIIQYQVYRRISDWLKKYIHFCMNGKIRQATPTSGTTLCCQGNVAIKVVARKDRHIVIEEDYVFFFKLVKAYTLYNLRSEQTKPYFALIVAMDAA